VSERLALSQHDNHHTLVTEFAESGAGHEVIMSIAGHVSRAMLLRYSHVRMEAKRSPLEKIAARQRAADEKRQSDADVRKEAVVASRTGPQFFLRSLGLTSQTSLMTRLAKRF